MRTYIFFSATAVFLVAGVIPAWGIPSDCAEADLGPYQNMDCSPGMVNVCAWSGTEIVCDNLGTGPDIVYAISGNDGENDITLVFGVAAGTQEFCCEDTDFGFHDAPIVIWTGAGDDTVDLSWSYGGPTWRYDNTSLIRTGDGDDVVYGSKYSTSCGPYSASWCDQIEVGDGVDYADGLDGGDLIVAPQASTDANEFDGGPGDDLLMGGAADDILRGGDDQDVLWGRDGLDELDGGPGVDYLYGGLCIDTLTGGAGDDWQCGGAGIDVHHGGVGDSDVCAETGDPDTFADGCPALLRRAACNWSPPF